MPCSISSFILAILLVLSKSHKCQFSLFLCGNFTLYGHPCIPSLWQSISFFDITSDCKTQDVQVLFLKQLLQSHIFVHICFTSQILIYCPVDKGQIQKSHNVVNYPRLYLVVY
nr:MAG TPA: hypothetical protein [Caudoviricetes sp.]